MKYYATLPENSQHVTHIKIETYYNLGGYNPFTSKQEERGYYLSVSPVERRRTDYGAMLESYVAFSGTKKCIKAVARKSKKAEEQAEENAKNYVRDLVLYVCTHNRIPVPEQFTEKEA